MTVSSSSSSVSSVSTGGSKRATAALAGAFVGDRPEPNRIRPPFISGGCASSGRNSGLGDRCSDWLLLDGAPALALAEELASTSLSFTTAGLGLSGDWCSSSRRTPGGLLTAGLLSRDLASA
jgi:hypothetical protein